MKSTHFAHNLRLLRKKSSITQEQLGNEVHVGRTTIANYESGSSNPTHPDVLIRLSNLFQVSIDELLTTDLSRAFSPDRQFMQDASSGMDFKTNHYMGTPKVIVVDSGGDEKMVAVSAAETQNYINRRDDAGYISSLPHYSLPRFSNNTYRIFEIPDNSMEPTFSPGDQVVGRWVMNIDEVRDGEVCVLVTKSNGVLVRRVVNRLQERGNLQLLADTVKFKQLFPLVELKWEDIYEVWNVEYKVSSHLEPPIENVYGRIADLETRLRDLSHRIQHPADEPSGR